MNLKYPILLGHTSDVREGFKKPLTQYQQKVLLANVDQQFFTISNVCPHQGSLILPSVAKGLSCQYHAWSWNSDGSPKSSGTTSMCNSHKLATSPTFISNNLIFNKQVSLPELPADFQFLTLVEERIDTVNASAKNIMDLFLDVDHIPVVHPKLYDDIGVTRTSSITWEYFDWGSMQLVNKDQNYSKEFLATLRSNQEEQLSAIWIAVYPYTMIEWQPGALFVTVVSPVGNESKVSVLKYRDARYSDDNWTFNSTLWESAWKQDVCQAESIVGNVPESHYEESKQHFHEYLKRVEWHTE